MSGATARTEMYLPLSDIALRSLKPGPKTRKVSDERGLYIEVTPAGGRWWRLKYRFAGKEKRLALGVYPEVSLREARAASEDARALLRKGVDPSAKRKQEKLAAAHRSVNTFELIGREWFKKQAATWAETHSSKVIRRLEMFIFPYLGSRAIAEVTAPELLSVIRRVEAKSTETAHRVLRECGMIFRYAIITGHCTRDVAADLRGALTAYKPGHFAATLEKKRLGAILRAMDDYPGSPTVRCALRLVPLVFVRPGELRQALWANVDLETATWSYLVPKTKTEHIVPLCTQAMDILRELQPLTGRGKYVFPGARSASRPMSDNAVLVAMRSMEIGRDEMTGHGFRAVARTLLDEELGFRPDIIEHQLAHEVRDPNGRAYNRTKHLPERRHMMQIWADYLDALKAESR